MDAHQAVEAAKSFAIEMLGSEGLSNLGLEEIEQNGSIWEITLGFSRPWNSSRGALAAITGEATQRRAYRIFRVHDADGKVISMKRRDEAD